MTWLTLSLLFCIQPLKAQIPLDITLPGSSADAELPCRYTGGFQQKRTLPGLTKRLITTGTFYFNCEQGLVWHTETPRPESLVYTLDGLYFKVNADSTVNQLKGKSTVAMGSFMLSLLSGDHRVLNKNFRRADHLVLPNHLILVPRKATLRQFIENIDLKSVGKTLQITIAASSGAETAIDVANVQTRTTECEQATNLPAAACKRLVDSVTSGSVPPAQPVLTEQ